MRTSDSLFKTMEPPPKDDRVERAHFSTLDAVAEWGESRVLRTHYLYV